MSLRPRATIHLANIVHNWRILDSAARPGVAGAVVKADAYGHGAGPVSRALAQAGCRTFFVAYGDEGAAVRAAVGPGPAIYAFNGDADAGHDVRPVLNSLDQVGAFLSAGQGAFALHVDTGMNRLGLRMDELDAAIALLGARAPALVISHLACADEPGHPLNARQAEAFGALRARFSGPFSLANTAGHWLGADFASDISRPGIGLYGGGTSPLRSGALKPGLTLTAPIVQVRDAKAGESVGYGATARLAQDTRLAIVSLGYGDGYLRAASGRGFGYLGDAHCPIIGRVSMDLVTLDATAAHPLAKPGARVEFIGARARLERQAEAAGTLGYELLTGLGARVERTYEG